MPSRKIRRKEKSTVIIQYSCDPPPDTIDISVEDERLKSDTRARFNALKIIRDSPRTKNTNLMHDAIKTEKILNESVKTEGVYENEHGGIKMRKDRTIKATINTKRFFETLIMFIFPSYIFSKSFLSKVINPSGG